MESWANYVGRDVAGRYRLESLLGVGSFGPVYAARESQTQQAVALRLLRPELGSSPTFAAAELTDFRHPQAVSVSEIGEFEETRFLIMPLASGQRLQVREPWPAGRILDFVRQISVPLIAFQHQYDLQHLHLHLGNVFAEHSSGKWRFQIADLGLASQVGAGPLILEAIRDGRSTPEFCSPEQLQGNVPSLQSDVYAFGAMLFQLFAGLPPFPYRGESIAAFALHVAKTPPPRFRDVSDQLNVDSYLESIILRCLSKTPAGRPGSIKELVEAYEMAYRDFQTRTLSGLKLSELDEVRREDCGSSPPVPQNAGQTPAKSDTPASGGSSGSIPSPPSPSIKTPNGLPTSDMIPSPAQVPNRNVQVPYRALPHGTDTAGDIGTGPSRTVLQESQALLQKINSQINPWAGMENGKQSPATPVTSSSPESPSARERAFEPPSLQSPAVPTSPLGTVAPDSATSSHKAVAATFGQTSLDSRSHPPSPPRVAERKNESVVESRIPLAAEQTLSPSSVPIPSATSVFGGQNEANLTIQLQQDWLRSQMPDTAQRPFVPTVPIQLAGARSSRSLPKAVLLLILIFSVAGGGVAFYGRSAAQHARKQVGEYVKTSQFQEAKAVIRQVHPLARPWLNRDEEVEQLLTNALKQVEDFRKERKLAKAIELTGQLDLAFASEALLINRERPRELRQEMAKKFREEVVHFASQSQLPQALDAIEGEEVVAFQKVRKKLSAEDSDFDLIATKKQIVQEGLKLASQFVDRNQPGEAFAVLDKWLKKLGHDDDVSPADKNELKLRHCHARVEKTLVAAREEAAPGRRRFPEALAMLEELLHELESSPCLQRRPAVWLARGEIDLELAKSPAGSVAETAERFESSWKDFTSALNELSQSPLDDMASRDSLKVVVLKSRAAMLSARARWQESLASDDMAVQPLLAAVRDYRAALADDATLQAVRDRLAQVRKQAHSAATIALQSAQMETSRAKSDESWCEAVRQLTLVVESRSSMEKDGLDQYARLLRGIARSSLRNREYANAIDDLNQATSQITARRLAEIGMDVLPESDPQERDFETRYRFAVGQSRLAWLVSTCPHSEIREQAKGIVKTVEQARSAVKTLEDLRIDVDSGRLKISDAEREKWSDRIFQDVCNAKKTLAVSWVDLEQYKEAQSVIESLQGDLDRNMKGWQADLWQELNQLLDEHVKKQTAFREVPPPSAVKSCLERTAAPSTL